MVSRKVPPAKVVRAVEVARRHLSRVHRGTAPPQAAMMDLITGAWVTQAVTAAPFSVVEATAVGT